MRRSASEGSNFITDWHVVACDAVGTLITARTGLQRVTFGDPGTAPKTYTSEGWN
jgi:hypothetical protein